MACRVRYRGRKRGQPLKRENLSVELDPKFSFLGQTPYFYFAIQQESTMKATYVLRQSENLVFNIETETFTFTARRLTDAKRRAVRKQFHEDTNLRLEDENGKVISIKRSGCKWEDKL